MNRSEEILHTGLKIIAKMTSDGQTRQMMVVRKVARDALQRYEENRNETRQSS